MSSADSVETASSIARQETGEMPFLRHLCARQDAYCAALDPEGQLIYAGEPLASAVKSVSTPAEGTDSTPLEKFVHRVRHSAGPIDGQRFTVRLPGPNRDSSHKCEVTAAPVCAREGTHKGYLLTAEPVCDGDNGENKSGGEDVSRDQSSLAHHEKMVALGTLSAGIAHEIGNPLASLSAVVQLLKRKISSGEAADHLETLHQQIQRIARIVRQMLRFSRPSPADRVRTDLHDLLQRTVRMIRYSQRSKGVEIDIEGAERLPELHLMPQLFQQAMVNLLLNSLDAVGETERKGVIRIKCRRSEDKICVMVCDNGCGMTPEGKKRAFEPFYTTKEPGKGTGLGLAVSYRLVQRQGGDMSLETSQGEGTTVTIYFPCEKVSGNDE